MKISLSWLKELVNYNLTPQELAEKLSLVSIGVKQITDDFLELDLTYNRGDLLSLRGIAREISAITNSELIFKEQLPLQSNLPQTSVKVESSKLCPFYAIAKIENLKVEESNEIWVKRLSDSGIRSVNNIADVTNLIMVEFGQPMHAFDARGVKDELIIVRTAKKGEGITTLDGKLRDLNPEDLLIADAFNNLGIAGVMGGKDSEISNTTSTIMLEAAIFDPVTIRKTTKRQGLYSEASKRFQHGLTKTNLVQALSAAIKMYELLGGKLTGLTLVDNLEDKSKTILLRHQKVNSLIGINISSEQIETAFKKLGFQLETKGENWEVTVPYWRLDINIEEDLIEEIARMYGYEKIEGIPLPEGKIPPLDQSLPKFIYDLKQKLKQAGLTEVETYSFYSTAVLEALEASKHALIRVANPISQETEYLRDYLWPNLVEVVGRNIRQGFKNIAVFEIGKLYFRNEEGKPDEKYRLAIALMNNSDNPLEELYQITKSLDSNLRGCKLNPKLMHPKRQTDGMAEVHLRILNKLGIEKRVAVTELQL